MAKKGAVQQLQAELNSDEDFEKFMEREGLLVLDVYTEWCGPCVGMIGSLKKIKLELGGDNLQLAICKADTVDYMERFRNKSEPTWLFASHKKIVNCIFGTNVPELMQTITDELILEEQYNAGQAHRKFYEWTELTPVEQERENKRKAIEEEVNRIEQEATKKRRNEYLTFVTDEIMERLPDAGVTLVMPNYTKERDIQKKLAEPADKCGLNMKDRRILTIKETDLEVILFDVVNPLHMEIYKKLFTEEILAVYWKTHDTELRDVLDLMNDFIDVLCNPQPLINEMGEPDPELKMPPVFKPWKFDVSEEIYKQIISDMGIVEEDEQPKGDAEGQASTDEVAPKEGDAAASAEVEGASVAGSPRPPSGAKEDSAPDEKTTADAATGAPDAEGTPHTESPRSNQTEGTTSHADDNVEATPRTDDSTDTTPRPEDSAETTPRAAETAETSARTEKTDQPESHEQSPEKSPAPSPPESKPQTPQSQAGQPETDNEKESIKDSTKGSVLTFEPEQGGIVTLNIPAIYSAQNKRGNAALIYLYFRHLTDHFLPPDPVPEPPHVAVIFDAIKKKDVCQLMATLNESDVLSYGYFSGIDPDTAHLLAKTHDLYAERKFNFEDKLVLKVAKKTSNVLLNFVGLGPTFVSFSTEEGKEECKKFFPFGYNDEDEDETSSVDSSSSKKKQKKKKKKKEGSGSDIGISDAIAEEGGDEGDILPDDDDAGLLEGVEPGAIAAVPADGAGIAPVPEGAESAPVTEPAAAELAEHAEAGHTEAPAAEETAAPPEAPPASPEP